MGLSPEYCVDGGFRVTGCLNEPIFAAKLCVLELEAIKNRPEALVAGLDHISSQNDLKRSIVKCFPKVTGFWRITRDKDKYLYNKDWKEVGLTVYFDLIDFLANFQERRAVKVKRAKTHREIGNVALGITTEVRLAALKYFRSLDALKVRARLVSSSEDRFQAAKGRASLSDLDEIAVKSTEADLLSRRIDKMESLGEAQANLAELQAAMGMNYQEPLPK
jgi:outer membrane protein TolC